MESCQTSMTELFREKSYCLNPFLKILGKPANLELLKTRKGLETTKET